MSRSLLIARLGALCYIAWGLFHVNVAHDIYTLGFAETGIAQGRLYQLAAYMLCIAVFAIVTAAVGNWRNGKWSYWLNLIVVGWAEKARRIQYSKFRPPPCAEQAQHH
jgi:hypothetical protein